MVFDVDFEDLQHVDFTSGLFHKPSLLTLINYRNLTDAKRHAANGMKAMAAINGDLGELASSLASMSQVRIDVALKAIVYTLFCVSFEMIEVLMLLFALIHVILFPAFGCD